MMRSQRLAAGFLVALTLGACADSIGSGAPAGTRLSAAGTPSPTPSSSVPPGASTNPGQVSGGVASGGSGSDGGSGSGTGNGTGGTGSGTNGPTPLPTVTPGGPVISGGGTGSASGSTYVAYSLIVELDPLSVSLHTPATDGSNLPDYPTTQQLTAHAVLNDGSETTTLVWTSSDNQVASVTSSGLVRAGSRAGTARVVATALDGRKSATCSVTVSDDTALSLTIQ